MGRRVGPASAGPRVTEGRSCAMRHALCAYAPIRLLVRDQDDAFEVALGLGGEQRAQADAGRVEVERPRRRGAGCRPWLRSQRLEQVERHHAEHARAAGAGTRRPRPRRRGRSASRRCRRPGCARRRGRCPTARRRRAAAKILRHPLDRLVAGRRIEGELQRDAASPPPPRRSPPAGARAARSTPPRRATEPGDDDDAGADQARSGDSANSSGRAR